MPNSNPSGDADRLRIGEYELVPESQSTARAAAVLPTEGSEDVSHLLGTIDIEAIPDEVDEYLPSPSSEWVVHVEFLDPTELPVDQISVLFGSEWREQYGGLTIYGKDEATDKWTFLVSADGPERVTGLQFAWSYYSSWSNDAEVTTAELFQARLKAIPQPLSKLAKVQVRSDVRPDEAHKRSAFLAEASEKYDKTIVLQLTAPAGKKFAGSDVWDVMLSLGLRWGDMDCFHWDNDSEVGDDYFFSVETSTPPGYFLPEEIAADRLYVEDLVFLFSLPRTAEPVLVYESMLAAVEYAKRRLGGEIFDADGQLLDHDTAKRQIQVLASELEALGFRPGSDDALRFF